MKRNILPLIILASSILSASCTKELKYSKDALLSIALKADPSVTIVLPKSLSDGVNCNDYTEGCLSAHIVQVKNLEFFAIEFMTGDQAIFAAKKFRGYYVRNWFFDDVSGEPVLEEFITKKLEGKKP